jgi:opacity protein-like surface antigen
MRRLIFLTAALALALAAPVPGRAADRPTDWSLSASVGAAFPSKTDIELSDSTGSATFTDVESDTSAVFGAKLSVWPSATRTRGGADFGFEVDVMRWTPDVPDQVFDGGALGPVLLLRQDVETTLLAANVLVRWPQSVSGHRPLGEWYPYLGLGVGQQKTEITLSDGTSADDTATAFQFFGGLKFVVARRLALLADAKVSFASHTFDVTGLRDERDVNAFHLSGGLAYHF